MTSYKGIKPDLTTLLKLRYSSKDLTLFANQKVNTVNVGNKSSRAKGRGMDFNEVRHYQPGDDIRLMHWSLTARLGKPFTKVYNEEKERSIYFVLDQSSAMKFGTRVCFKSVKAVEALALIGFGGVQSGEKVGGIVFDDHGYSFFPSRQNKSSLVKIFNQSIADNPLRQVKISSGLSESLKSLYSRVRSSSVVIVISDFAGFDEISKTYLKLLSYKSKVINICLYDPIEKQLPSKDVYSFGNDQKKIFIDGVNKLQHDLYESIYSDKVSAIKGFSRQHRMGFFELATNDELVSTINAGVSSHAIK